MAADGTRCPHRPNEMAPDSPRWPHRPKEFQMALDGTRWPHRPNWMAPDGFRRPHRPKEFQMAPRYDQVALDIAPHCPRWFQICKDGSKLHQMLPECVEGNWFSQNLDFCSLSNGRSRIRKNVVTAPACPRWPRYIQIASDDSRCPQMTTRSYYPGKLFYLRGRSIWCASKAAL